MKVNITCFSTKKAASLLHCHHSISPERALSFHPRFPNQNGTLPNPKDTIHTLCTNRARSVSANFTTFSPTSSPFFTGGKMAPSNSCLTTALYTTEPKDQQPSELSEVLGWNDNKLEIVHDYIQRLFPLPELSPYNPTAPVLTEDLFMAFRSSDERGTHLRSNLRRAFDRMCKFYGFRVQRGGPDGNEVELIRLMSYRDRFRNWVKPYNHNHARITRIIRCLRILGLDADAAAFWTALESLTSTEPYQGIILSTSVVMWKRAAKRPLYLAPSDYNMDGRAAERGAKFLVEFEENRKGREKP